MKSLPSGLVPQEDQGVFLVEVRAPEGTTLKQTREMLRKVEDKVKKIPELESFSLTCGYGMLSEELGGASRHEPPDRPCHRPFLL